MSETPTSETHWLTLIGLGEDGPDALSRASRDAMNAADVIMGPKRHLTLIGAVTAETIEWPVPFSDGITILQGLACRRVVVLASGDPFWFGAGAGIARHFPPDAWICHPAPSSFSFSLAGARMAWPLKKTVCLGLHATPPEEVRRHLCPGARLLVLLRDANAVQAMAALLTTLVFGSSALCVMQSIGGPALSRDGFTESRLYATDYDRRYRSQSADSPWSEWKHGDDQDGQDGSSRTDDFR